METNQFLWRTRFSCESTAGEIRGRILSRSPAAGPGHCGAAAGVARRHPKETGSWLITRVFSNHFCDTVDGRNPAPPKKPWHAANTNKSWFPLVSKRCKISSTHSTFGNLPFNWGLVFGKVFLLYHRSGFHFPQRKERFFGSEEFFGVRTNLSGSDRLRMFTLFCFHSVGRNS